MKSSKQIGNNTVPFSRRVRLKECLLAKMCASAICLLVANTALAQNTPTTLYIAANCSDPLEHMPLKRATDSGMERMRDLVLIQPVVSQVVSGLVSTIRKLSGEKDQVSIFPAARNSYIYRSYNSAAKAVGPSDTCLTFVGGTVTPGEQLEIRLKTERDRSAALAGNDAMEEVPFVQRLAALDEVTQVVQVMLRWEESNQFFTLVPIYAYYSEGLTTRWAKNRERDVVVSITIKSAYDDQPFVSVTLPIATETNPQFTLERHDLSIHESDFYIRPNAPDVDTLNASLRALQSEVFEAKKLVNESKLPELNPNSFGEIIALGKCRKSLLDGFRESDTEGSVKGMEAVVEAGNYCELESTLRKLDRELVRSKAVVDSRRAMLVAANKRFSDTVDPFIKNSASPSLFPVRIEMSVIETGEIDAVLAAIANFLDGSSEIITASILDRVDSNRRIESRALRTELLGQYCALTLAAQSTTDDVVNANAVTGAEAEDLDMNDLIEKRLTAVTLQRAFGYRNRFSPIDCNEGLRVPPSIPIGEAIGMEAEISTKLQAELGN